MFVTDLVPVGNSVRAVWSWRYEGASVRTIGQQYLIRVRVTPKPQVEVLRKLDLPTGFRDFEFDQNNLPERLFLLGKQAIVVGDKTVEVCDATTGKVIQTLSLE